MRGLALHQRARAQSRLDPAEETDSPPDRVEHEADQDGGCDDREDRRNHTLEGGNGKRRSQCGGIETCDISHKAYPLIKFNNGRSVPGVI